MTHRDHHPECDENHPVRPYPILAQDVDDEGEGVVRGMTEVEMQDEDIENESEVRQPKIIRDPGAPTEHERRAHCVSHLPYRRWCKICVQGRGRDLPHSTRDRGELGAPLLGVDFFFLGEPGVERTVPAVVMRDYTTKALFAHVVPGKRADFEWTARQVVSDIAKMPYTRVVIRSDQEPATTAMVDKIRELRNEETIVEWSSCVRQGCERHGRARSAGSGRTCEDIEIGARGQVEAQDSS